MAIKAHKLLGHVVNATAPTIRARVAREQLVRTITLDSDDEITRNLAGRYAVIVSLIQSVDGASPEWLSATQDAVSLRKAFEAWCALPESDYSAFEAFHADVTRSVNADHLTPDGGGQENPT